MAIQHYLTGAAAATLAALLAASPAQAQASAPAPAPTWQAEIASGAPAPAIWRAADEDSEVFLFGTFHFLKPGAAWRSPAMEDAFAKSDLVYFEVEADNPDAQSIAVNAVMLKGFNPDGALLTDMLDAADAQKLRAVTQGLGLPLAAVNPMRPWNAFLTLSVQFITSKGFEPGAGADAALLAEARTLGKDLAFFETMEEQLALFTELDPETEEKLLAVTLRDWDDQEESFDALFTAWRTGDVDVIDEEMNEAMRRDAPEVHQRIMVDRNIAWAQTLDAVLRNGAGTTFVAVGAGHLAGDDYSVPALLAEKGYEVSRYRAPANDNRTNENGSDGN